ncbi:MAG: family 78 glycoside hydrolase catalytic domain [Prolixibacteraceae bacterium]|nr:family 78 glycoside hydrolase catalytic domain [Prolixibacteraceae bacterium]MBN2774428.1 family 78 glycoside hydrolase catalytic domain [Prolixibacteraceae bacterium]
METHLGIDIQQPHFSWQMETPDNFRGCFQTAYHLVVTDQSGEQVWDSGKQEKSESIGIKYEGASLKPETRYNWTVTVWDQNGDQASLSSWFETGLMNTKMDAWEGAKWIGGGPDDMVLYSHYLSVFKIEYTLQLDKTSGSTKAGFIYGANDDRLLNKDFNIYGIESAKNENYIKLELDISELGKVTSGKAKLKIYRVGYSPDDSAQTPFKEFEISESIISESNKYDPHRIFMESVFGTTSVYIDGISNENKITSAGNSFFGPSGVNLNPVGSGGDYIAFPMVADIGFCVDPDQEAFFSDVVIKNYREPSNILFKENLKESEYDGIYSEFIKDMNSGITVSEGKYHLIGNENGCFYVADPSHNSMPVLRTSFVPDKKIKKARLYVTSRGIYEIYLNGEKVGSDYFNPGHTQYNKTHMYQTYDVTTMLNPGKENIIGAMLGEGWWSGNFSFSGNNWNFYGDRQSLLAKLEITFSDGTTKSVVTNDTDWKYFNNGPVQYGSFFQGEVYDARKESEIQGWKNPGYNDEGWENASEINLEGTAYMNESTGGFGAGTSLNYNDFKLIGQIGKNASVIKELKAQSVTEVRPGIFVYDMGQNMVGIPKIEIPNGQEGQQIRLRYAEVLYPDLEEYGDLSGMIMLENIRAALAQDIYILKDGTNIIQPHFTFHGYRYIEITGIEKALPVESVKGLVISSIKNLTASYNTSNDKVNRLFENIVWSQYGNFLSIPTDCPQRNERMGWSGDLSVFSRTATYLAQVSPFLNRHMIAMRDDQTQSAKFTDIAPGGGGFGGLLWGSAGITVPWEVYQQYNDIGILEDNYEAMKAYMLHLNNSINPQTGLCTDVQLGDWLGPQVNKLGADYLATAYHIFDLGIMQQVASVLGKNYDLDLFTQMLNERKSFFNTNFINSENKTLGIAGGMRFGGNSNPPEYQLADTQTSYAVGLATGAFNDEEIPVMAENLAKSIERENIDDSGILLPSYSLMTGFIGTAWISKALSDNGYIEHAYKLLQQESYPSWLYPVDQGATSIWERLNSYTKENGFGGNNSMNSFNHYSFGAVGQWMMAYSLGIQRDVPGFKHFILQPEPDPTGKMKWAEGYYDSMYGRINSRWEVNENTLNYSATVPANTKSTLYLPTNSLESVKEGGRPVNEVPAIKFIKFEKGKAVMELESGSYNFQSDL